VLATEPVLHGEAVVLAGSYFTVASNSQPNCKLARVWHEEDHPYQMNPNGNGGPWFSLANAAGEGGQTKIAGKWLLVCHT